MTTHPSEPKQAARATAAEIARDASSHRIIISLNSRSFEMTPLSRACVTSLLVFHCNDVGISYHFLDIQRHIINS